VSKAVASAIGVASSRDADLTVVFGTQSPRVVVNPA